MIADRLLSRLEGVRQTGQASWLAKCSSHDDKHPSLSIKETNDGTLLIKCWTGCSAHDVVSAVGLELSDLFPPRIAQSGNKPVSRPFPASDAIRAMCSDVVFLVICASDMVKGESLKQDDINNLAAIGARLRATASYLGINP